MPIYIVFSYFLQRFDCGFLLRPSLRASRKRTCCLSSAGFISEGVSAFICTCVFWREKVWRNLRHSSRRCQSGKPVRHIRVFITRCFRYSAGLAPVNAPASWPSMDRTKPQPGFPFTKRKTKAQVVRVRALTAGGALADLCQRLVSSVIAPLSNCLKPVNTE